MSEQPDQNCYTLPDGDCVGGPCMHNPEIKREDTPIARAHKAMLPDGRSPGLYSHAVTYLAAAYRDADELQAILDLMRQREQPWIARWQRALNKPDTLPDYGEFLIWLLDALEAMPPTRAAEA